jgi:hypothetical protein
MSNQRHKPKGPGGGQFSSGDGSGGTVTATVRERQAMRAMTDQRKLHQNRTSIRNLNPVPMHPMTNPNMRGERADVPHMRGVNAATSGKTLADVSALGTTQGAPVGQITKGPTQGG